MRVVVGVVEGEFGYLLVRLDEENGLTVRVRRTQVQARLVPVDAVTLLGELAP